MHHPSSAVEDLITTETENGDILSEQAHEYVCNNGALNTLETLSRAVSAIPSELIPYLCKASLQSLDQSLPIVAPHLLLRNPDDGTSKRPQAVGGVHDMDLSALSCELCTAARPLSTGCTALDLLLGGGIQTDTPAIVEISGAAGAGKTQVVAQLCVTTAMPPSNASSIYASTEGVPPVRRIQSMAESLCRKVGLNDGSESPARRVFIEQIRTSDHLLSWARLRLPYLIRTVCPRVRLVVIDSVAAVYRAEFTDAAARASHLTSLVQALKQALSQQELDGKTVCVCVNQVSQSLDRCTGELDSTVPALGTAWGQHVDTRMFLKRVSGDRRCARILHSSYLPCDGRAAGFRITAGGVVPDEGGS